MTEKFEPGINHIEIWVSDLEKSGDFYAGLFNALGWKKIRDVGWSSGRTEIYLREETSTSRVLSLGVHHLCFQATEQKMVDDVCKWLIDRKEKVFSGPIAIENYSPGYYTCDFYDPDGMILEVAYTPNMKL